MVVLVDVGSKGSKEGDVRRVEGVCSLTDQLAFAALETLVAIETLVAKVADAVFPAGGARATQEEQGRGGRREEAVVPPPPSILVAGHDEGLEPHDEGLEP